MKSLKKNTFSIFVSIMLCGYSCTSIRNGVKNRVEVKTEQIVLEIFKMDGFEDICSYPIEFFPLDQAQIVREEFRMGELYENKYVQDLFSDARQEKLRVGNSLICQDQAVERRHKSVVNVSFSDAYLDEKRTQGMIYISWFSGLAGEGSFYLFSIEVDGSIVIKEKILVHQV